MTKKKYSVYGLVNATKYLGVYEADNEEDAIEQAAHSDECYVSLCYQCSNEIDADEIYEIRADEISDEQYEEEKKQMEKRR